MDRVILNDLDFENRNEALYFLKKLWKFIKALFLKDTLKTLNICNKRRFGISLSSGEKVKILNDQSIYWGNQLECEFGGDRYFGNLVGMDFIMTCTYEENGENLELLL